MNDSFVKRFLLTCNPWFLASTLFLLLGIYLVYVDPKLAGNDTLQINISFYSLQAYEILCLGVVFLFRKIKLFYDSVFLIVILSILLFIPFITFNQALHYEGLDFLGYTALVLAAFKICALKMFFKKLNLPWMILVSGFLMLAMNFAIPFAMRGLNLEDDTSGQTFIHNFFAVAIPVLGLFGYLAMNQIKSGKKIYQSKWVPITLFECFFTVTLVNLMSVMYVYDIEYNSLFFSSTFLVSCFLSLHPVVGLNKVSKRIILAVALFVAVIALGPEYKAHFAVVLLLTAGFSLRIGDRWIGAIAFAFLMILTINRFPQINMKYGQLCIASLLLVSALAAREVQSWKFLFLPGLLLEVLLVSYHIKSSSLLIFSPMSLCYFITLMWDEENFKREEGMIVSLALLWAFMGFITHANAGWEFSFWIGLSILAFQFLRKFVFNMHLPTVTFYISCIVIAFWPIEQLIQLLKRQSFSILVIVISFMIFIAGTIVTYNKRVKQI